MNNERDPSPIGTRRGQDAATRFHVPLGGLFAIVAASTVLFGAFIAGPLVLKPWKPS